MRALAPHAALLDAGGEIITATGRQAEALKRRLGLERADAAPGVWATPLIRPLAAWLERAADALEERPVLLAPEAASRLWQRIVAGSRAGEGLVNVRAAAALAERAWQLIHEWRIDPNTLEATTAEEAAFAGWAREYAAATAALGAIERARLGALIAARATELVAALPGGAIGWHGFGGATPARASLIAALGAAGRASTELTLDSGASDVRRHEAATPPLEFEALAAWVATRLTERPTATLGLIVPDLTARAGSLKRLLDDRLAPELKSPGAPDARPYRLASGRRLGDHGIVAVALDLLALGGPEIDVFVLGAVLRSPYLAPPGSAATIEARAAHFAALDAQLRSLGARTIPAAEILRHIAPSKAGADGLGHALEGLRRELGGGRRLSAAAWAEAWPRSLRAAGWPLGRVLGAAEYAAARAFHECLARFGALARVLPPLTASAALAELQALVAQTPFEPEIAAAPVLVLDALEDPGIPFDGLWVSGLTADRFPGASAPNPFLPAALQRALGMPGASAEGVLSDARATLERWQRATPELVLSHARQDGEASLMRSGLLPMAAVPLDPTPVPGRALVLFGARALESAPEPRLPPLAPGLPFEGGVRGLERQSECPFKAAAELRLGALALESPGTGLPRRVRGDLAHAALANFWRGLRSRAELEAVGPEGRLARTREAVAAAFAGYHRGYLPGGRLRELESRWLVRALLALAEAELERSAFTVIEIEHAEALELAGRTLRIRLDRLDRLEDGSTVLLDYKTGRSAPKRWAGPRPDALQLAVYAALRAEPPEAVAIVRLPLGLKKRFVGVAAREGLLPDVRSLERARQPLLRGRRWEDLLEEWKRVSTDLARDFAGGRAVVDPVEGACEYCALAGLCRIEEPSVGEGDDPAAGEAGEAA